MPMIGQNALFVVGACGLLFIAYAYLTRWRHRSLLGLSLSGSQRWGLLWPILSAGRALVKRTPVACSRPMRIKVAALLALLPAAAGVLMLFADAAQPAWPLLAHAALPGFAHDVFWHLLWFNASLLGLAFWDAAMHAHLDVRPTAPIVSTSLLANLVILLGMAGAVWLMRTLDLREMAHGAAQALPVLLLQPLGFLVACVALWLGSRRTLVHSQGSGPRWPDPFQWQQAGAPFAWLHLTEFLQEVYAAGLLVMIFGGGNMGPAGQSGPIWFLAKLALLLPGLIWFDERWISTPPKSSRVLLSWLAGVALANLALTAAVLAWRMFV